MRMFNFCLGMVALVIFICVLKEGKERYEALAVLVGSLTILAIPIFMNWLSMRKAKAEALRQKVAPEENNQ